LDLATSDYYLFSPLKDAIRRKKFEDDEVISEVRGGCDRHLQMGTTKAYRLSHLGDVRPSIQEIVLKNSVTP
jgi:hypothetical protein